MKIEKRTKLVMGFFGDRPSGRKLPGISKLLSLGHCGNSNQVHVQCYSNLGRKGFVVSMNNLHTN